MKKLFYTVVVLMLLGGGQALAILPPDASLREPQLRRERIASDQKYEKYIEEQRKIFIQRYEDVSAGLDYPPWKLTETGAPKPGAKITVRKKTLVEKGGHNWLIGLSGLIVLASLFYLIKRMTREADNR